MSSLQFPYMFWAHTESFRSPYCLSQSGMPAPDADLFEGLTPQEALSFPGVDALPELERRLAVLHGVRPEQVIVTVGASAAMHLCALHWFRPGSRVVTELPSYEPFRALPEFLGADTRLVERRLEDSWQLDPEEIEQALEGARDGGHVFLSNPHNPTGVVLDRDRVTAIGEAAAQAGGVLISCEAYMDFAPAEDRFHAHALCPAGITIGSMTKAYGLGALRIGWIILGEGLLHERVQLVDKAYLAYIDPPTASLVLARQALERLPAPLQPVRRADVESRPHLVEWLTHTDGIEAVVPPFGIISFPRVRGIRDTLGLARFLAESQGVDVVPGDYFGLPGHLRVCCGVPEATLTEGLVRLGDGLRTWRERGGVPSPT